MAKAYDSSEIKTWVVIGLILAFILFKGAFAFIVVGDNGMPDWDYRPVPGVPGESPYAMYEKLPHSQHVRGRNGE